ncbi:NB-ARC domain-containing protein [Actinoplanes sp. CA-252034]|uniref:NB-ARC domain-containing protein n=1 Tax=Actinoplanes sp. CA-252034 TaxID=3239906 RepID=UPI003D9960F4
MLVLPDIWMVWDGALLSMAVIVIGQPHSFAEDSRLRWRSMTALPSRPTKRGRVNVAYQSIVEHRTWVVLTGIYGYEGVPVDSQSGGALRADGVDLADVRTVEELATLLRRLRRRQARQQSRPELTYREIADLAGWSHGIIGEYLSGRILPSPDRFDVLAALLGASPSERGRLATARDRVDDARRTLTRIGSTGPPHPVPRQIPPDVPSFVGRATALDVLHRAQRDRSRQQAVVIVLVWGDAGMGKSALVAHWAQQMADQFPDGQLHTRLGGPDPDEAADKAVRGMLEALGVPASGMPESRDRRSSLLRSMLSGRRSLIVLEDAVTAEQVRTLLPGTPGNLVVVTSRQALTGLVAIEGARPLALGVLSTEESRLLLQQRLGADRLLDEPAAVDRIVEACRGTPLALAAAAAFAATRPSFPLSALADEVDGHGWASLLPSPPPALSAAAPVLGRAVTWPAIGQAPDPAEGRILD